tara:strand:+ start:240 stop:464 length:225 start_codon:yes stop_codon:yes gene_type:complete
MKKTYKLTLASDSLDTNLEEIFFDDFYELQDYYFKEIERRVQFTVSHSPYSLTDQDIKDLEEQEQQLITFEINI